MFEHLRVFIDTALPWVAVSVVLAVVMTYSKNDKEKEYEE